MKRLISILMATVLATLAVGCASNVKQLGKIGDTQYYRVKSTTFSGPNFSALVSKNICEETPRVEQVFGGPGIGATVISAGGQIGSSVLLGTSFPKFPKNVGDSVNVSGGNSNAHDTVLNHNINEAKGGDSSSTASSSLSNQNSATGGNATGGNGTGGNATGGTGGSFTPPGLVNNPGHDGTPGKP